MLYQHPLTRFDVNCFAASRPTGKKLPRGEFAATSDAFFIQKNSQKMKIRG
ncbi:hypothetical protein [Parageobacillus thermoglucosidasius]|uniref:Uncharacterized protein n=1 Tax=Parageobacillus thermoglucosidasius TaxID=1426 RepID=A0AB38R6E4_PARTM|nr:hypothetical protein [Parageobacillus thermoglucosidasius]UOE78411.1 hypothetical protein IMI45_20145 [Parageobacillus thermoglucosidasius]